MAKPPENLAMNVVPNLLYRNNIQYPVVIADSGFLSENSWHKKHFKKKTALWWHVVHICSRDDIAGFFPA